jgi:hypothetical protein
MTVPLLNNIMARRRESGINNILLTNNNSKPSNNNRTVDVQYVFNANEKQKLLNKLSINKNKIISYSLVPVISDDITGDFLVKENNFIIATENGKLIELDIS